MEEVVEKKLEEMQSKVEDLRSRVLPDIRVELEASIRNHKVERVYWALGCVLLLGLFGFTSFVTIPSQAKAAALEEIQRHAGKDVKGLVSDLERSLEEAKSVLSKARGDRFAPLDRAILERALSNATRLAVHANINQKDAATRALDEAAHFLDMGKELEWWDLSIARNMHRLCMYYASATPPGHPSYEIDTKNGNAPSLLLRLMDYSVKTAGGEWTKLGAEANWVFDAKGFGSSPIHIAAAAGNVLSVRALLDAGWSPSLKTWHSPNDGYRGVTVIEFLDEMRKDAGRLNDGQNACYELIKARAGGK